MHTHTPTPTMLLPSCHPPLLLLTRPTSPRAARTRHHVRFLWLRCSGLPQNMARNDDFRSYVRGYEPRASFPHYTTTHRLAESVDSLQKIERKAHISRMTKEFKLRSCVGVQLDMWTDSATHTSFGCVTMTSVQEPISKAEVNEPPQLFLRSEILDFDVYPDTSKTGENIKQWFLGVLQSNELPHCMITGVTPDGAADGQCGLGLIETIAEKVDTCQLHVLQRAVLFALGLAGASSKNDDAKALLRKHNRLVQLSRQSLAVGKAIREAQLRASVPEQSVMTLTQTATTRWGNQYDQLSTNCVLRGAIDPALDKYKRENRNNKEAIVEANESDQGSKVGVAVPASELGISSLNWEESQEMEGFLAYPYDIKQTIELRGFCTGAQGLMLLYDLNHKTSAARLQASR